MAIFLSPVLTVNSGKSNVFALIYKRPTGGKTCCDIFCQKTFIGQFWSKKQREKMNFFEQTCEIPHSPLPLRT